jgi:hypothetical protein
MSVLKKNSARQRDQERARLIWLLTTDKVSNQRTYLSNIVG